MPKFRKKPIIVEATRITRPIKIETLEGDMVGRVGDWLITGTQGEQYPCKDDIFREIYEEVEEAQDTCTMQTGGGQAEEGSPC